MGGPAFGVEKASWAKLVRRRSGVELARVHYGVRAPPLPPPSSPCSLVLARHACHRTIYYRTFRDESVSQTRKSAPSRSRVPSRRCDPSTTARTHIHPPTRPDRQPQTTRRCGRAAIATRTPRASAPGATKIVSSSRKDEHRSDERHTSHRQRTCLGQQQEAGKAAAICYKLRRTTSQETAHWSGMPHVQETEDSLQW